MIAFVIAAALYSFSMSITPGPTNIIMMTTGVNHGFRNTLPFATGAATGFTLLVFVVALGFGSMLSENKQIMDFMGYAGAIMISYMGYKIAFSSGDMDEEETERPSFMQGAILQWINPKSWIACIAGVGAFNLSESMETLITYMIPYMIVGYSCVLAWGYAGSKISGFLKSESNLKYFNYIMGGSLVIVAIYLAFMDK
ncbi:MAG: LysE family translocator [Emcibacteraceae bacterium]|nr:LysE family translocator [Emcibacteraceae bacterium]MDG1857474.1 LysE family translocator [Emcibacteraceae bacterium]